MRREGAIALKKGGRIGARSQAEKYQHQKSQKKASIG